jgi:hypothetical protein
MKIINSLDINKSTGPISIPNRILNTVLVDISNILTDIFNISLKTGKFSTRLKTVKVVPVSKTKVLHLMLITIDLYLYSQILIKSLKNWHILD